MKVRPSPALDPSPLRPAWGGGKPTGAFVQLDGELCYQIAGVESMKPFLCAIPSDTDLWMFISSRGGLTAGRVNPAGSLFPYLTVDRLHDAWTHTGPITLLWVLGEEGERVLWEPFSPHSGHRREWKLSKNLSGNRIIFEEINSELGLSFRYSWAACDEYGWVRTAVVRNLGSEKLSITLLDGLRNVLPHGASLDLYQQASNLVDAYKKSEVDPETGLALFSLTAGITDRPEAIEVLRANTVWCTGLPNARVHLSLDAVEDFRAQRVLGVQGIQNGTRGNYLVSAAFSLPAESALRWQMAADVGRDHAQIARLRRRLQSQENLGAGLDERLQRATGNLIGLVAEADGLQMSRRTEAWAHHFANVLFNNMRGGVFVDGDKIPGADFSAFVRERNRGVFERVESLLETLPEVVTVQELSSFAQGSGDEDLRRLCMEYLPLHFGRRHGDPSRPWNRFSIRLHDAHGNRLLNYEGNWRDIFQNWEALATAFPSFLPNMVAKFVNASTVDGFNPYRIGREGVDWEGFDSDHPWKNIGYWGDHQIIYLLRLLESLHRHHPKILREMLSAKIFSYADVPYRIVPYRQMLQDPARTIRFDTEAEARSHRRVEEMGGDGKLLRDRTGGVHHANLLEKLLVPLLSKLSNLVPDAGIWMNTQRPEWNDANNALAGCGASVVTLAHLRRYLAFLLELLEDLRDESLPVAEEVASWFDRIASVLGNERALLRDGIDAWDRKRLLDALGLAFSDYRAAVYEGGFSGERPLAVEKVLHFCRAALEFVDWGLQANRREDGLYHSYNVLEIDPAASHLNVSRLPEMLEGQAAILGAGLLDAHESLGIIDTLFDGPLYREDQRSFLLYPERELPGFLAKNVIPEAAAEEISLVGALLNAKDESVVVRDADGVVRFAPEVCNAADLSTLLDQLGEQPAWAQRIEEDREAMLGLYELVFHHKTYTGRSGVMYGYEGLGCIYWHMVAKFLLAVQESIGRALEERAKGSKGAAEAVEELARRYFRIRRGLGYEKAVVEFGAFPTDPYSHTPAQGGARQPGMTGQVKEEILTRRGELGVRVMHGRLSFAPYLLRQDEFLTESAQFRYLDVKGNFISLKLPARSLAFTLCQVPVIYELTESDGWIEVHRGDASTRLRAAQELDEETSAEIFSRAGTVTLVKVGIPAGILTRV